MGPLNSLLNTMSTIDIMTVLLRRFHQILETSHLFIKKDQNTLIEQSMCQMIHCTI